MSEIKSALNKEKFKEFGLDFLGDSKNDSDTVLLEAYNEEKHILEDLDMSHNKSNTCEDKKQRLTNTRLFEEKFKKDSYTGHQVKEVCERYGLRVLPTSKYLGIIPSNFSTVVSEFKETNKLQLSSYDFFVMAPEVCFEEKGKHSVADLTLFYRKSNEYSTYNNKIDEDDVLVEIKTWGGDYGLLRELSVVTTLNNKDTLYLVFSTAFLVFSILWWIGSDGGFIMSFIFITLSYIYLFIMYLKKKHFYKINYNTWNE
jgi:hypothetical protein